MAERLAKLRATQVAWVRFPARPTISAEKWFFSVTLRPGARHKYCICFKIDKKNAVTKAKVFPHLEAWVRVGCGMPYTKGVKK
jgi:hypothetical protein